MQREHTKLQRPQAMLVLLQGTRHHRLGSCRLILWMKYLESTIPSYFEGPAREEGKNRFDRFSKVKVVLIRDKSKRQKGEDVRK